MVVEDAVDDIIRAARTVIDRYALLPAGDIVVVGVSGGADSLVLLRVLMVLADGYGVHLLAGHLEHGIRGQESLDDAAAVQGLCAAWGVPLRVEHRDVPAAARARRLSVEEAARQERYRFLGGLARSVGGHTVAVAHHADDQVETVLMHLLRGSGLAGLRGMRPLSWLDELHLGEGPEPRAAGCERVRLIRPLLAVPRRAIEACCRAQGWLPRLDRTNLDTTYARNRLRHELIPLLETYNPNIREVLCHTAEALAGDYDVLREHLAEVWPVVVRDETAERIVFDLAGLRALPDGSARSVLREGVRRLRWSLRNVGWVHVEDALQVVRRGQTGAAATLPGGLLLRLEYEDAVLAAVGVVPPSAAHVPLLGVGERASVACTGVTPFGDGWELVLQATEREALCAGWDTAPHPLRAYLDAGRMTRPLLLRARQPGDVLEPLGMGGKRQRLADLMINVKIPRAERDRVPLLMCGEDLVWVIGWRLDERFAVKADTRRVLVADVRRTGA